jgi:hypothetical protein
VRSKNRYKEPPRAWRLHIQHQTRKALLETWLEVTETDTSMINSKNSYRKMHHRPTGKHITGIAEVKTKTTLVSQDTKRYDNFNYFNLDLT